LKENTMQRTLVIVSAVALAAMGASFAACSSDDNSTSPGADSGLDTSAPVEDSNAPVDSNVPVQDSNLPPEDSNAPPGDSNAPPGPDAGTDAKSPVDAGEHDASDAGSAADSSDAEPVDASDAGSSKDASDAASETDAGEDAGVTLTVLNFLNWCTVTINSDAPASGVTVLTSVPAGSTATLVAVPRANLPDGGSSFIIGPDPWFGTNENDGGAANGVDQDAGGKESTTAQVTIGAGPTQCVSVCCAKPDGGTPLCPATNPCLP
jgi:hypothetical protein